MKLKSQPSDFQVTELSEVQPTGGAFALYQLSKTSLGTPEAVSAVLQHWNLPRDRISYGGMKDRHAVTTQYATIYRGPTKDLKDRSFTLRYLGQTSKRFTAQDITGNQFVTRLRGIDTSNRVALIGRLQLIQNFGLVNYFDEQRFGSVGKSARFIAEPWCKGDYQAALYLALAEPNRHDRPREAEQKAILREHWGDWSTCKDRLDRSHRRSIVTYLVDHPTGFKRAISLVRSDLRSIYLAAFQSGLWNRWLSRIIESRCQPWTSTISSMVGPLYLPQLASDGTATQSSQGQLDWLRELRLPLPSARQHDWPSEFVDDLDAILVEYGLERREIRLKYPRDTFFSKGLRDCWLNVQNFEYQWTEDELHPGKECLNLSFQLQRGAYATMIVKMLQLDESSA
jgi:tRNA pseudouridine13 synthase